MTPGTDEMRARPTVQRTAGLVAALLVLGFALSACGGSGSDKAGGAEETEPRVLTLANGIDGAPPAQLESWAKEVSRLSGGTLRIQFENGWRHGEALNEADTLDDVKAGKVDMGWVGARVFDTVGVTSFQALLAPLLVDSYDLEARVFEAGIPERMLAGVSELDLVGIGVLPGPMRKVLGVSKPFVRPADFEGEVVGLQDSALADLTLSTLGATPHDAPSGAALDGLDGYEQQLGSILGNNYDAAAGYVTGNVDLWPRPLVLVMGKEVFETLTAEEQAALREAAKEALPAAMAATRGEDAEAVPVLCRRGMTFAVASESDLAELRGALQPVYAELEQDPDTKAAIEEITALKTEVAVSAEAPACETAGPSSNAAPAIPDGTYETTLTEDDWVAQGLPADPWAVGVFTMTFDGGELTIVQPDGQIGFRASYTVFRDQIDVEGDGDHFTARWAFDGETLNLTDVDVGGVEGGGLPYVVTWESHPWTLVQGAGSESAPSIPDGAYETTITKADWLETGAEEDWLVELPAGVFTMVLDSGALSVIEPNGHHDFEGTYTVFRDQIEIRDAEGTLNAHWSFDGESLTLTDMEGCCYLMLGLHPWVKANRASAPIEGVYRASFTREALEQSPLLHDLGEVNDQNWGDLTLTLENGHVTFEQQNDLERTATSGTFTVEDDKIVLEFREGVNAGEVFAARWSLYQDRLTLTRDEALGILPTPYIVEPWQRVG
jgi:TRAP-type C4-dicarboxylate transport system substrate-binding protein